MTAASHPETAAAPDHPARLPLWRLISVAILGFALTAVSNTLEPAVLGHKVLQLAPDRAATALGFTTVAGLIVASLTQPIVGVISDRARTPLGRRMPFFIGGALGVALCLYLIALAPAWGVVVAGILLIQVFSNTVQGPWQALIPDHVPHEQRGQAASVKAIIEILAALAIGFAAGKIVARAPDWGQAALIAAVSVPVALYAISIAVTWLGARERPDAARSIPDTTIRQAMARAFHVDFKSYPAFGWWFANRMLFWAGLLILRTFLLLYAINVLGMAESAAQSYVANLNLILGGALILATVPAGWLSDRMGRRPFVMAAGALAALGALAILLTRDLTLVTVGGAIVGVGAGAFISVNWALVTDIIPRDEAARYLGMANIATAGGSGLGRLIGALLIDPINAAAGGTAPGYLTVYGIAAAFFLLSAVAIAFLPAEKQVARGG